MNVEKNIIVREIAGEYILIPVGDAALKSNGIYAITEVGAEIWKRLTDGKEENKIISELLEEYDVDEETLRKDYSEFIDKIKELGLITE